MTTGGLLPERGPASRPDKEELQAREVLHLFDAKAVTWSAKYVPDGPLVGRLARLSAAVGRHAQPGDRVLDLGCGSGELARTLAAAGLRVAGCDISQQMLMHAVRAHAASRREGCAGWVRLAPAWRRLPFASGVFDVVVAASVLEYVAEPAVVLHECARVLRPGGVVLYTIPDLRHPVRWAEWLVQRLARAMRAPSEDGRSRWHKYRAYLRASRHRHRARWWLTVSVTASLRPVPFSADGGQPALRLMAFRRADSAVFARRVAERHEFEQAVSTADAVIDDLDVSLVVIATPHDVHEELVSRVLAIGREVWCEMLALTCAGIPRMEHITYFPAFVRRSN
jgi:SAM-dependent methyltransferase